MPAKADQTDVAELLAAAGSDARTAAFEGLLWLFGLMLVVVLAGAVVAYLRRRLRPSDASATGGFDLAELRRLRNSGELTVPEYEALRDRMLRRRAGSSDGQDPAQKP